MPNQPLSPRLRWNSGRTDDWMQDNVRPPLTLVPPKQTGARTSERSLSRHQKRQSYPLGDKREAALAITEDLRRQAWKLVHDTYTAEEYAEPNEQGLRYSIHDALVDAATIAVLEEDTVTGTVSIYPASPLGYPADILYKAEIDRFCSTERNPVEIGSLAVSAHLKNDRKAVTTLFDLLSLYSRCLVGATDLIMTVNPKHRRFYERMLLFEQIGEAKDYHRVKGAPAVLMRLDLDLQKGIIRWEHGEGPMPEGYDGHHTMYRNFSSIEEEGRRVAWLRKTFRPLEYETIHRYFVEERPLIPQASQHIQEYLWDFYVPRWSLPVV